MMVHPNDGMRLISGSRAFLRGANWNNGSNAGVFSLNLNNAPSNTNTNIGFRCARYPLMRAPAGMLGQNRVIRATVRGYPSEPRKDTGAFRPARARGIIPGPYPNPAAVRSMLRTAPDTASGPPSARCL